MAEPCSFNQQKKELCALLVELTVDNARLEVAIAKPHVARLLRACRRC